MHLDVMTETGERTSQTEIEIEMVALRRRKTRIKESNLHELKIRFPGDAGISKYARANDSVAASHCKFGTGDQIGIAGTT